MRFQQNTDSWSADPLLTPSPAMAIKIVSAWNIALIVLPDKYAFLGSPLEEQCKRKSSRRQSSVRQ